MKDIESLEEQLQEYGDGPGQLHYAVKIVAEKFNITIDPSYLTRYSISEDSVLSGDDKSLESLGFPKNYFHHKPFNVGTIFAIRDHINHLLITAASFIVPDAKQEQPLTSKPIETVISKPKILNISLGLVLKGTDLGKISEKDTLSLVDIQEVLWKADFFLCTFRENMNQVKGKLNLGSEEPDRTSEHQVLLIIHFESELEQDETFKNKLEVQQFLKKDNPTFTAHSIETLNKAVGLKEGRFVRS